MDIMEKVGRKRERERERKDISLEANTEIAQTMTARKKRAASLLFHVTGITMKNLLSETLKAFSSPNPTIVTGILVLVRTCIIPVMCVCVFLFMRSFPSAKKKQQKRNSHS